MYKYICFPQCHPPSGSQATGNNIQTARYFYSHSPDIGVLCSPYLDHPWPGVKHISATSDGGHDSTCSSSFSMWNLDSDRVRTEMLNSGCGDPKRCGEEGLARLNGAGPNQISLCEAVSCLVRPTARRKKLTRCRPQRWCCTATSFREVLTLDRVDLIHVFLQETRSQGITHTEIWPMGP
jgi:hypothetical protein